MPPFTSLSVPRPLFDRTLHQRRLARAAKRFPAHDFLHRAIALDIIDRLESINRSFSRALITGPGSHLVGHNITPHCSVGKIIQANDPLCPSTSANDVILEEERLAVRPDSLDLIICMMSLHHINDIPGTLTAMRQALRPDGLMIAALPGEDTLAPLKEALYQSEATLTGGVSPRIAPFATLKDLGALMQRAGFTLPVADIMRVPVTYKNPMTLLHDLRGMGETNILIARKKMLLRRDVLANALAQLPDSKTGLSHIPFDIIFLTGWAPHHSQQQPLKPGTAKTSLAAAIRKFE